MTPIYNQYIKPNLEESYRSEIAFINSKTSIVCKNLFYVNFTNNLIKNNGFYLDNNDLFKKLYSVVRNVSDLNDEQLHLKYSNNLITRIQPVINYYSYIKVIKDKQNPELEGKIMIFKFGRKVSEIIAKYLYENKDFSNTFQLIVSLDNGYAKYHVYDKSHFNFINETINITDNTLDINSEISFKQINLKTIEREEKLKNIKSEIELKQIRYEEYLKLKEEFENE